MGLEILAYAGLGLAAGGAYMQYQQGQKASDALNRQAAAQQEQARIAQRKADIENIRNVRSAIRQARIARAAIINQGAVSGTLASSGVLGGVGSIQSQHAANLGFYSQVDALNRDFTQLQVAEGRAAADAAVAEASARQWGAFGSLGGTIFGGAGGFKTIFGDIPKRT